MSTRVSLAVVAAVAASCAAVGGQARGRGAETRASTHTPEQVRAVQRSLGERGHPTDLTGVYDQRTRAAVAEFQRSRGMAPSGELTAPTARALGIDPRVLPGREREEPQDPIQYHAWTDGGG